MPQLSSPLSTTAWSTSTSANYSHFGNTLSWIKRVGRLPAGDSGTNGWGGRRGSGEPFRPQSCPSLDLALWVFSLLTSHPVPSSWAPRVPTPLVPKGPSPPTGGLSSPLASPTDARLPVRVEHKLDMAAAPGTLLCVIARVLAATITIVARHCARREESCQLASPWVPQSPQRSSQPPVLPPPASQAPHPSSVSPFLPTATPGSSHLQSRWFLVSSKPGRHSQAMPPLGVSRQM